MNFKSSRKLRQAAKKAVIETTIIPATLEATTFSIAPADDESITAYSITLDNESMATALTSVNDAPTILPLLTVNKDEFEPSGKVSATVAGDRTSVLFSKDEDITYPMDAKPTLSTHLIRGSYYIFGELGREIGDRHTRKQSVYTREFRCDQQIVCRKRDFGSIDYENNVWCTDLTPISKKVNAMVRAAQTARIAKDNAVRISQLFVLSTNKKSVHSDANYEYLSPCHWHIDGHLPPLSAVAPTRSHGCMYHTSQYFWFANRLSALPGALLQYACERVWVSLSGWRG